MSHLTLHMLLNLMYGKQQQYFCEILSIEQSNRHKQVNNCCIMIRV